MKTDIVERWGKVDSAQDALLHPSPFGLIEGRQDYRGFQWASQSIMRRLVTRGTTLADIDLSGAIIQGWISDNIQMKNVVIRNAKLTNFSVMRSEIRDCRFEDCTISDTMANIFNASTIDMCTFANCSGTSEWIGGVQKIDNSTFVDLTLENFGNRDPLKSVTISNSRFSGTMKRGVLPQGREGRQLEQCDLRAVKLQDVSFPGVNMENIFYPDSIQPYVIPKWNKFEHELNHAAALAIQSNDRHYRAAGIALKNILKEDAAATYWIKGRWPRGSRYAFELDSNGGLKKQLRDNIKRIYAVAAGV